VGNNTGPLGGNTVVADAINVVVMVVVAFLPAGALAFAGGALGAFIFG
jgi:hypothetical protein